MAYDYKRQKSDENKGKDHSKQVEFNNITVSHWAIRKEIVNPMRLKLIIFLLQSTPRAKEQYKFVISVYTPLTQVLQFTQIDIIQ